MKRLLSWFRRKLVAPTLSPVPMTDLELRIALQATIAYGYELRRKASPWVGVPKIKCPVTFPGWGYVEGRKEALKINDRLHLSEADDDYGFTEYCVLVDQVPALLLCFQGTRLSVSYLQEGLLLSPRGFSLCTVEDYHALPEPVQRIMHDVLSHLRTVLETRPTDSVANVLSY